MLTKSTVALIIAHASNVNAFQQHCSHRLPHGTKSNRCGGTGVDGVHKHVPNRGRRTLRLNSASLPSLNDESYPQILPSSPKGVIFDMDGTLIQHCIDFAEMRERIYAVADKDSIGKDLERDCVLSLAECLSPEGREECKIIFNDIEQRAINDMKIVPGGAELIHFLAENGLPRAVLTRNLEKNVPFMEELYLREITDIRGGNDMSESVFHPIVARDTINPNDEEPLKAKPYPDGILHI